MFIQSCVKRRARTVPRSEESITYDVDGRGCWLLCMQVAGCRAQPCVGIENGGRDCRRMSCDSRHLLPTITSGSSRVSVSVGRPSMVGGRQMQVPVPSIQRRYLNSHGARSVKASTSSCPCHEAIRLNEACAVTAMNGGGGTDGSIDGTKNCIHPAMVELEWDGIPCKTACR